MDLRRILEPHGCPIFLRMKKAVPRGNTSTGLLKCVVIITTQTRCNPLQNIYFKILKVITYKDLYNCKLFQYWLTKNAKRSTLSPFDEPEVGGYTIIFKLTSGLALLVLSLTTTLLPSGAPPSRTYPLWDGRESVAEYAQRAHLPATKSLDLPGAVKLDLVLVPAGKFVMGMAEPTPLDESKFHQNIVIGKACLAASGTALLVMLLVVACRAIRNRRGPQLSLGRLTLITLVTGGCVLSGLHWRHSARALETCRMEFNAAMTRYKNAWDDEKPAHPVTLSQPFYMGKFTVTQEQYEWVVGTNPSNFSGKDNPVELISWNDAQAFIAELSELTKESVRLPSEAEWEFACRAGTTTSYSSGHGEADLARVAWTSANSKSRTHPVGQKEANAFGLFDMEGNVWQWCQDLHGDNSYRTSPTQNPIGSVHGAGRMLRGGSWCTDPWNCRATIRIWSDPENRFDYVGFRIVVPVTPQL